ncbi:hypothetical protein MRX96_025752 [Rhipicephalus microplus]
MAAETHKDTEEVLDSTVDAEEVGYEAVPEYDEGCADEGAENANGEELTEVEEEIVEEEAEESQEGEEEAEECQRCEEEVGKRNSEEAEESQDLEEAIELGSDHDGCPNATNCSALYGNLMSGIDKGMVNKSIMSECTKDQIRFLVR